jgi:tetratricopeptide (TPR) repeat protein
MTAGGGLADGTVEELRLLGERLTVQLRSGQQFLGSGFLVAPDTVLTCAHVVRRHPTPRVAVDGRLLPAEVVRIVPEAHGNGKYYAFPDLAEVRITGLPDGTGADPEAGAEPGEPEPLGTVWLDTSAPLQSVIVSGHGFSNQTADEGIRPDTLRLETVGRSGRSIRLRGDRMVPGFSGGPVLSTATGRVCGLLKATRGGQEEAGGWLIPVEAVAEHFPDLVARNSALHRPGTPWFDTAGERRRRQRVLFGPGPDTPVEDPAPPAPGEEASAPPRGGPARLLSGGAMPFVRRPELDELRDWCRAGAGMRLRLLSAPGGSGKTRLAAELARELRGDGWIAGFADRDGFEDPVELGHRLGELTGALTAGFPVLAVFDYAQARLDDIGTLLTRVHRARPSGPFRLRVLLLSRSEEPLWTALHEELEGRAPGDWALNGASARRLPATLTGRPAGELAADAFTEFARRLGTEWLPPPPSLAERAARQDSLLGVLATALDAVVTLGLGEEWNLDGDPLDRVCSHEIRHWQALVTDRLGDTGPLAGRSGRWAAQGLLPLPTLAPRTPATGLTGLMAAVRAAAFPGRPPLDTGTLLDCLRELYPAAGDRVAPLEPDRIGEILVRRVLARPEASGDAAAYLGAVLDRTVPAGPAPLPAPPADPLAALAAALTPVPDPYAPATDPPGGVRTPPYAGAADGPPGARANPRAPLSAAPRTAPLLDRVPAQSARSPSAGPARAAVPAALLDTLDVLARARGCTAAGRVAEHPAHDVLDEALAGLLRTRPALPAALLLTAARVPHAEPLARLLQPFLAECATDDLTGLEPLLPGHPSPLSPVSALVLGRLLAVPDPEATESARALRLRRLLPFSLRLEESGHREAALTAAGEAVLLGRELLRTHDGHAAAHAAALHNLALVRYRSGRIAQALEPCVDAVDRYRDLPGAHHLETATALSLLALLRLADGQVVGAADDAAEGVLRCDRVPGGERRDDVLLQCLQVLAACRRRTGLPDEAADSAAEAVELLRALADRRPGRYLARLPDALQNQGIGLIQAGRPAEAYPVLREAVRRRSLQPGHTTGRPGELQAQAVRILARLSGEFDEFADEHASWRHMQAANDGRSS